MEEMIIMPFRIRNYNKMDILKEMMLTLIFVVALFGYWIEFFIVLSFVFNSYINLSFHSIILMAIILSFSVLIFQIIKITIKIASHA
jgi:hypothetical protein